MGSPFAEVKNKSRHPCLVARFPGIRDDEADISCKSVPSAQPQPRGPDRRKAREAGIKPGRMTGPQSKKMTVPAASRSLLGSATTGPAGTVNGVFKSGGLGRVVRRRRIGRPRPVA